MLSIVLKISAWLNDYFLLYTFFLKIAMAFRLFYIYFMNRSTMCQFSKYVCAANLQHRNSHSLNFIRATLEWRKAVLPH